MSATVWVNGPYRAFSDARAVRLVVPVPECGWLRLFEPFGEEGVDAWRESARRAALAVGLNPARSRVLVQSTVHKATGDRFQVAEDVRPSLKAALDGLVFAGVFKSAQHRHVGTSLMVMGSSTGDVEGLLVLRLMGVSGG